MKPLKYLAEIFALSFLGLFCNAFAASPKNRFDKDQVEKLLWEVSVDIADKGNYEKVIRLNQELIEKCEKAKYTDGVVKGYCNLGNIFARMGKHKESFLLLKFAEKESKKLNSKELEASIDAEQGNNYSLLGLYTQAQEKFRRSILISKDLPKGVKRNKLLVYSYSSVIYIYEMQKKMDSAFYYSKIAFDEVRNSYTSNSLAYYYIYYKKDFKSAEYYLKMADQLQKKAGDFSKFDEYSLQRTWGEWYEQKKLYDSARIYYLRSLTLAKTIRLPVTVRDTYWLLHRISDSLLDKESSNHYLHEYARLYDSISKAQKPESEFPIQQYIQDKEQEYKHKEDQLFITILLIVLFSGIVLWILIKVYQSKQKSLAEIIKENEEKIKQKEKEALELKSRINEGFEEVIELAKKNSPEFITRFIEVYPEFYRALLKIYPDINPETLKFCALLRLNFSTKEIAEYNFITPRAIQLRKNRVRKKLNISSAEDIYTWMNNLE
ncbi:tetratricopeptide (TPR) repeat protein [Chryseobacterium defluvii]|uniref:Tetratricopeptide (TPR) repeat protein n=1 Tax=Chryseobacterium defluvii TaxID=160396 RepID=A0A840KEG8_9FLAO|nr:hypothetical protein [Chryseobacterium defluvii]MBB4805930.1 tetratricopeptide (TPR) repeat protein [Chryseobacterium defluvii]